MFERFTRKSLTATAAALLAALGVGGAAIAQEVEDLRFIVLEHDAEELHVRLQRFRGRDEDGMLLPAWIAPRRPEVDDERLSAELLQVERLAAADGFQREVRSDASDEGRVDLLRILSEAEEKHADDCGGDEESVAIRLAWEYPRTRELCCARGDTGRPPDDRCWRFAAGHSDGIVDAFHGFDGRRSIAIHNGFG